MFKKLVTGTVALAIAATVQVGAVSAEGTHYVPSLSYRTGPYAGNGTPVANGFADYMNMLNERDGGIGGIKVEVEECETGYNTQKGVECYEATKVKGALVYSPLSTGITLQLIPKAPVDQIPVFTMGYGLSAAAIGEKFPWTFTYPTTYWSQMSAILKWIDTQDGGIKGKKIGFIYLVSGYGKEPIPLLDQLSKTMGFEVVEFPVAGKEMQTQSSHWLNVRKEKPDWMIMWGWGAMNSTAIKEAAKIKFPLDHFIGNWWSGAHADLDSVGEAGKGYRSANMSGIGADFPAIQDILKLVVDKGMSQADRDKVGDVLYNRGVMNAAIIAEAITVAQAMTGKAEINGADMRDALENVKLTAERWAEIGLGGFTAPLITSCSDHGSTGAIFLQQWDGSDWVKTTDLITPMVDVVQPLLVAAAEQYVADKPDWETQTCN
mgnify:CR=1 FL=1